MKHDIRRMALAAVIPLFLLFILYILKFLETGMDWNFTRLGVYPMEQRGVFGIFAHPLVHSSFKHLFANTIPLFFLMWCLFYFYRHIAPYIFFAIWIGCGALTFLIGKPGWHIGASGIIYGLAFFLFFSGILRKHVPLIAISLLITFLYGGLVWNMFPQFAKATTSWEGHLSGAIAGYSFSADPKIYGAVNNFEFHIKDIVVNNGAEMIVAIAGEILRMPGLPKKPQAEHIDIVDGNIEGLS